MFGLAGLKLYGAIGGAILIALFLGWVWRIDSLRASHLKDLKAERAASALFAEKVKLQSEVIVAKALQTKNRVETAQTQVAQENDSEIRRRIADAVAAVRLRASGGTSASGRGNTVPSPANASSGTNRASEAPVLPSADDLAICAENTVKAEGWQAWWKAVSAIDR